MKRLRIFLASVGHRTFRYPPLSPPLGILSLAAYLRDRFTHSGGETPAGLDFALLDQHAVNCANDVVIRRAVDFDPDIVGLRVITPGAYLLPELTRGLRRALPKALMLIGGPHVSAFAARAMVNIEADAAVVGEGERTFEAIVRAYLSGGGRHPVGLDGSGFDGIPGLIWRDPSGEVITNPGTLPLIEDLDTLPFPAYDLLDLAPYWKLRSMAPLPPRKYIALLSSRGCPHHCMYCHQIFGKRFRAQSAERIVAEIEHWQRTFGVRDIEFLDDIFNQVPERVIQFSELLQKRGLKIKVAFPNALRCDTLTPEIVDALVAAGTCYSACALETGSPRLQKYIGKHLNIPRFLEGVELLARGGVLTHGYTMLGFPTETEAEMQMTIDVVCGSRLHTATFFTVTPYPNTELYDWAAKTCPEKLENLSYADMDYAGIPVNLSTVPDEVLFAYQRKAFRSFYLNPRRMIRIARSYPRFCDLPRYLPELALRLVKGLFSASRRNQ